MRAHDRGNPHTPLLVVLDHLAGYNGYIGKTWGFFPRTAADQEVADLLETQLFGGMARPPVPGQLPNPEVNYLQPTRHGELCDVVLSTATGAFMGRYPVILLAGEVEFSAGFVRELETAVAAGSRLLLQERHVKALRRFPRNAFSALRPRPCPSRWWAILSNIKSTGTAAAGWWS
jgi:hypothetical protein